MRRMNKKKATVVIILIFLLRPECASCKSSYAVSKDGVYEGVVVAIDDETPQQNCPLFLDNVEVSFTLERNRRK